MTAVDAGLTATDLFCGAGGSMCGLHEAGFELVLGANHSERAIETAAANFSSTDFLCTDINHYDMRRLPHTRVLWASVICTEISPAGGNRKHRGQRAFEELGHVPADVYERTRACALDVIRATEVHRYEAVIVENVVEFARDWELYDWWVEGMCKLSWKGKTPGYNVQVVNASAAHVYDESNAPAPQWRDRIFIVFTRSDVRAPDLELRPPSWCEQCEGLVDGVQWWKRTDRRRVGKYGQQYLYRCPIDSSIVEPLVMPAAAAIDWTDVGERIGDRKRPLAKNTIARIEAGLAMFAEPVMVNTNHDDDRTCPTTGAPMPTRTVKIGDGVACPPFFVKNYGNAAEAKYRAHPADGTPLGSVTVHDSHGLVQPFVVVNRNHNRPRGTDEPVAPVTTGNSHALVSPPFVVDGISGSDPRYAANRVASIDDPMRPVLASNRQGVAMPAPFVTMLRNNETATSIDDPLATVATARHHYLTVPPGSFVVQNFGGNAQPVHTAKSPYEPVTPITTKDHHALVIPYRKGARPRRAATEPLPTVSTREAAALLRPSIDVDDCWYRMFKPREHLRAQRFDDTYVVTGNIGEQTMQAGNAVPCNVAQWIGRKLAEVLG